MVSNEKCDMCCVIIENIFIFNSLIMLFFSYIYIWVHFLQDVSSFMLTNFSYFLVAFDTTNM
jgi:hypothetical protein